MNRNALAAALVAGLVLLAGCSSGFTGSSDGTATGESALDGETTAEEIQGETGTVNMYISDEQNAIGDFEHLNVTITKVGVKPAGDGADDEDGDDDTETEDVDGTATDDAEGGTETTDETNATDSAATETQTPGSDDEADDEIESDEPDDADEDEADDADEGEADDADEDEADDADEDESDDEWVEYEVDNRTVDLTQLQGANATKLSELDVPNGSYEKVFVHVSEVNGTLADGSDQRVKLPSGKLQLNSEFTVGNNESVDFVFDITTVKAGNSGKYILKPVISESGTDVEIDDVDERGDNEGEREDDEGGADERDEDRSAELNASFDGDVAAGENATLRVTSDGEPVEGATVFVDGERIGTTDANGTDVIQVPDNAEELEVEVTHQGAEAELEIELDEDSDGADGTESPDETTTSNESQQLTVG